MPKNSQLAAIEKYANLLNEIKIRISCINSATSGQTGLPGVVVREFCFLQLRFMCELIALGCLVAHGDIKEAEKLKKEYAADKIVNLLEKLHPHFYPTPITSQQTDKGFHHITPRKGSYLTKADLSKLYSKCGDELHRGNLKKLLTPKTPIQKHYPDIIQWAQKINDLLQLHSIFLKDGQTTIIAMLANAQDNNNVQVAIAEAFEDGHP